MAARWPHIFRLPIFVARISQKLLFILSCYFTHDYLLWSCCAPGYFHLICIFNMAARRPSLKNLLLPFQENYWSDHDQILHRGSPNSILLHLGIFVSFAYLKWLPGGHMFSIGLFFVSRISQKLLFISSSHFTHGHLLWSCCTPGYFHLICIFNMAAWRHF